MNIRIISYSVRKEKKTTEGSGSDLNGSFSKSSIKGVTTIDERNGEKFVIGMEGKICL